MKRVNYFAFSAALMMAAACSEPLDEVADEAAPQNDAGILVTLSPEELGFLTELSNGTPKISVDSAAKVAMMVMGNGNTLSKRSLSVTAFGTPKSTSLTKSFTDSDIDTTFYVFNATNDNGFAVISADARIPQQVLAFSETGNIELDSDSPTFDVFLDYAQNYAADCIAKAQEQRDSIINSIYEKFGITLDLDSANSLSKTKRVIQRFLLTCQCYTNTNIKIISEVKPLIKTHWHQRTPYNDNIYGKKCDNGYAAGCVAIATAQLMAFWHHPQILNGIEFDWNILCDDSKIGTPKYNYQAASLVAIVGNGVKMDYDCNESLADVHNAVKLLGKLQYHIPNQLYDYKYDKVVNCLNHGRPVLMNGYETKKNWIIFKTYKDGHTWLADGYVNQRITVSNSLTYVVVEIDDETGRGSCRFEKKSGVMTTTVNQYLHFNWGWRTNSSGYYNKAVFDSKQKYEMAPDGRYVLTTAPDIANIKYNLEFADNIYK